MQSKDSPILKPAPPRALGVNKLFVLSWGVGMMTGLVVSAIALIGALALGYVSLGSVPPLAQAAPPVTTDTPTPPLSLPADGAALGTPTPPGTPTASPNLAATATQACSQFLSAFPGTPCPAFTTPSNGP